MPVRSVGQDTEATLSLRTDPALGPVIEEHGPLVLEPADNTFRRLVRSIVSQQLSTASARSIRDRLFSEYDVTPEEIASADPQSLREVGLSGRKSAYLQNVARSYLENDYSRSYFRDMSNRDVIDELTRIKGIGPWTGKMFLQFCLGRKDVFPVEDLGIRRGMQSLYGDELTETDMIQAADEWRPYRSIASLYLWRLVE